jgi:large subunit ribosomal protein L13
MIIDATNTILGRLATYAAKQALLGEEVNIINSEKAIVTGEKQTVFARYKQRYARGTPSTGPFILRMPDRLVRRTVRGMLPYKIPRGAAAYKKVMCYVGVPAEFEDKETITIDAASKNKLPNTKYVTVGQIATNLGGQQ